MQGIVVTEPKRSDPSLAFELAELERLQREGVDSRDEFVLDGR
jgi:hypothetical protein